MQMRKAGTEGHLVAMLQPLQVRAIKMEVPEVLMAAAEQAAALIFAALMALVILDQARLAQYVSCGPELHVHSHQLQQGRHNV